MGWRNKEREAERTVMGNEDRVKEDTCAQLNNDHLPDTVNTSLQRNCKRWGVTTRETQEPQFVLQPLAWGPALKTREEGTPQPRSP